MRQTAMTAVKLEKRTGRRMRAGTTARRAGMKRKPADLDEV